MSAGKPIGRRSTSIQRLAIAVLVLAFVVIAGPLISQPHGSLRDTAVGEGAAVGRVGNSPALSEAKVAASGQTLLGARADRMVGRSVKNDVSPPLRNIQPLPPTRSREKSLAPDNRLVSRAGKRLAFKDNVLQSWLSPLVMPAPDVTFGGMAYTGYLPSDANGDVGPDHYVQWVNASFEIFTKTGTPVYGPAAGNTLWAGFGGPCETRNDGDPIVIYDSIAQRWLMSQFAIPGGAQGYYQCLAISLTSDPTSAYFRYAFQVSSSLLNDYPKFGVWPDAYYMSLINFSGTTYAGPSLVAFDRTRMLAGLPATYQKFDLGIAYSPVLPSDLDGWALPPAGAPNPFVGIDDHGAVGLGSLYFWKYHVDWATPANSTLTGPIDVNTEQFTSDLCLNPREACIAEPSGPFLEAISDRPMYRLAYRNFGDHESLVFNHTIQVQLGTGYAGIRWYELRGISGTPTIYQQGTFGPTDGSERWMGSIAMDHVGNMALGYSASGHYFYPSIRYTGRLSSDSLGSLPQGEFQVAEGGYSQQTSSRWGDYTMMTVDPTDDCTFWYTGQYTPCCAGAWDTRITAFRFPSCTRYGTATPTATSTGTATPTTTGTPTNTATPTNSPTQFATNAYAYLQPGTPLTVTLGSRFTLDLRVGSGSNNVVGAQSYIIFTNSMLQNVDVLQPGCVPTDTVRADLGVFDTVLQNEVCNSSSPCDFGRIIAPPSSIAFASGVLLNLPARGTFRVAQVAFCATSTGRASLHWEFAPPAQYNRDTEVIDEHGSTVSDPGLYRDYIVDVVAPSPTPTTVPTGTPTYVRTYTSTSTRTTTPGNTDTPTATGSPTNTPAGGGIVVGHVVWQGISQPNSRNIGITATLTLCVGGVPQNYNVSTDASGFFTATTGLSEGGYNWQIKGAINLSNAGILSISGGVTNVEMGTLRAGDCNNSNTITSLDFNILKNTFGKSAGEPGYDGRADFNRDSVVSSTDFNVLKNNFGQSGTIGVCP